MKTLEFSILQTEIVEEIEKLIGFVSEDIIEYKFNGKRQILRSLLK